MKKDKNSKKKENDQNKKLVRKFIKDEKKRRLQGIERKGNQNKIQYFELCQMKKNKLREFQKPYLTC